MSGAGRVGLPARKERRFQRRADRRGILTRLFRQSRRVLIAAGSIAALWFAFVASATLIAPPRPAAAAFDGTSVPFKGAISGVLAQQPLHGGGPAGTDWSITIGGMGHAPRRRRVDALIANDDVTPVDPAHLGPTDASSFGQFTGPHGDKVFGVYHRVAGPTVTPGVLSFGGTFGIQGGEGRFKGATGSGNFVSVGNVLTNAVEVTFGGAISPPQSTQ